MAAAQPLRVKVLVFGPTGAGKTALVKRLVEARFALRYAPTIGVDFGVWPLEPSGGRERRLHVFDLGGGEHYADVRAEFFRADTGLHAALLCFDAADRASFEALNLCLAEAQAGGLSGLGATALLPVALCACKSDLRHAVAADEARAWAEAHGATYFEASASIGSGVTEVVAHVVERGTARAEAGASRQS